MVYQETESIYTVSEAFSMQPATWIKGANFETIELIEERLGAGIVQFYVGLHKSGFAEFKIRVDSCTLTYKQSK